MRTAARESETVAGGPGPGPAARRPRSARSTAIALQRAAGNRAAGRVLARWVKHPDPEKKGVVVPDVAAADYNLFNPPKNE
jgi:hypothetical protein